MTIKRFTTILGVMFIIIGVLGFIPGLLTMPHEGDPALAATDAHGRLLGLFMVNSLHNLIHIAFGIWALGASRDVLRARQFCKANAVIYGVFAVMGLFPGLNTFFGLVPLHGNDVWLHAVISAATGYFGYVWAVNKPFRTADLSDTGLRPTGTGVGGKI